MTIFLVVLGAVLAAGGGLLGEWQSNRLGTKRDDRAHANQRLMAQEAGERERLMAREALNQERLERTYTEVGMYLSHHAAWARSVRPLNDSVQPPDPIPESEMWRIETLVTLHGSPEVRQLLDQFNQRGQTIRRAEITIQLAQQTHDDESSIHKDAAREDLALEGYRKAMHDADRAIRAQMSKELNAT
jgi:hypothetical protein